MSLSSFYKGETKRVRVTIYYDGSLPDLCDDTVTLMLKSSKTALDADAEVNVGADVSTEGISGVAKFELGYSVTANLSVGMYFYEITWTRSIGDRFVLESGRVGIMSRLAGVT